MIVQTNKSMIEKGKKDLQLLVHGILISCFQCLLTAYSVSSLVLYWRKDSYTLAIIRRYSTVVCEVLILSSAIFLFILR
uniref:Uncharacterized protein n=1 Tax=Acrobeloides nanus TaxID=290746 RepID=A0A914DBD9_9BILA